jgi:hypothetical protein
MPPVRKLSSPEPPLEKRLLRQERERKRSAIAVEI